MDYQKTGNLIASLRKEKNLTQKQLADQLGITDRAVSKWERGLGSPDISLLDDLSRILDISILEILKGRRLDKAEIVNNESIIESMNYSKENFKHVLKKYFNIVSILIVTLISLILIIYNIKSVYYLNKTYHSDFHNDSEIHLFAEIENNIEKIKNNQGTYNDEDYQQILAFINKLENNLKEQNNLYYFTKKDYKYKEIYDFYNNHQNYIYLETSDHIQSIYEIVHKYDSSVVNNVVRYYTSTNLLMQNSTNIWEQLSTPYYNNRKIDNEIVVKLHGFILIETRRDSMILNDIVKVGGIDE